MADKPLETERRRVLRTVTDWSPTAENAQLVRTAVADALRHQRHGLGMSQAELAEVSGLGRDTIVRLEKARQEPRLLTLIPITFGLGRPLSARLAESQGSQDARALYLSLSIDLAPGGDNV
jgi:transcriptional regulator with XRE-family HTH domain